MDAEVQSLQILDRDARLEEFVDEAEQGSLRPLQMWRRDSIESYLVVPAAMAQLMIGRKPYAAVVEALIADLVTTIVQELKEETLDRISTRYRRDIIERDSRNVEPAEANRKAREVMQDDEQLLRLTRGEDLLGHRKEVRPRSIWRLLRKPGADRGDATARSRSRGTASSRCNHGACLRGPSPSCRLFVTCPTGHRPASLTGRVPGARVQRRRRR